MLYHGLGEGLIEDRRYELASEMADVSREVYVRLGMMDEGDGEGDERGRMLLRM